ncbi:hypothetical protein L218DRAFT_1079406 [Marasmius fiardii PR-910]|nr:hypothetical protein L218DRAFT_1079406 [Marasmius fiardii PR-910]
MYPSNFGSSHSTSSSSPTSAFSRIRFDDNPRYIEPPSPYMTPVSTSTPSLYPPGPSAQPMGRGPPSQSTSSLSNFINPLLQHRNPTCLRVGFYSTSREVRYRPSNNDPLAEPALAPHIQVTTITIMASDLPWTINVAAPPSGHRMTVGHVLTGLLQSLETRVTQDEFLRDPPARRDLIQRNFASRCAFVCKRNNTRLEENEDWNRNIVRRGDYLGGWSFRGLSVHNVEGTAVVMRMHYAPTSSY